MSHGRTLSHALSRRAWLKNILCAPTISALTACRQETKSKVKGSVDPEPLRREGNQNLFNELESRVIQSVQQHLLPDDGDGPDAKDIQAFHYLNFAMTDPYNIEDRDLGYLKDGANSLNDLSYRNQRSDFFSIHSTKQELLLSEFAESADGEGFLSLLMHYLSEALLLDPIYGGNPNEIGWKWLEHQAGFPRPVAGKTYRDFI